MVEISGIYVNAFDSSKFHKFTLKLDRTPRVKDQMIKNYREVFEKLQNFDDPQKYPLVPNYIPAKACDTVFRYILDEKGRKTAEKGLNNFFQCVSEVFAFNPKFEKIEVFD